MLLWVYVVPTEKTYTHTHVYRLRHSGISLLHHFSGSLSLFSIPEPPFPSSSVSHLLFIFILLSGWGLFSCSFLGKGAWSIYLWKRVWLKMLCCLHLWSVVWLGIEFWVVNHFLQDFKDFFLLPCYPLHGHPWGMWFHSDSQSCDRPAFRLWKCVVSTLCPQRCEPSWGWSWCESLFLSLSCTWWAF